MAKEKNGLRRKTILKKRMKTGFAHIPNATLQDPQLTWKATGLLSYLLSLPDDWEINLMDLSKRKTDGRDSTSAAVRGLVNAGYMRITVLRDGSTGQFVDTVWEVSATSDFSAPAPVSENPTSANPPPENPESENPPQESKHQKVSKKKTKNHNNESPKSDSLQMAGTSCPDDPPKPDLAKEDTGAIDSGCLDTESLRQLANDVLPPETLNSLIDLVLTTRSPQAYLDLVADAFTTSGKCPPDKPIKWLASVIHSPGGGDLTPAYRFREKVTKARRNEAARKLREELLLAKSGRCQADEEIATAKGKKILDAINEKRGKSMSS